MTKQGKKRASKKKRQYSKTEALLESVLDLLSKRQKQEVDPARAEAQGVPEAEDPPPPPYAEVAPPGHWIPSPPWPKGTAPGLPSAYALQGQGLYTNPFGFYTKGNGFPAPDGSSSSSSSAHQAPPGASQTGGLDTNLGFYTSVIGFPPAVTWKASRIFKAPSDDEVSSTETTASATTAFNATLPATVSSATPPASSYIKLICNGTVNVFGKYWACALPRVPLHSGLFWVLPCLPFSLVTGFPFGIVNPMTKELGTDTFQCLFCPRFSECAFPWLLLPPKGFMIDDSFLEIDLPVPWWLSLRFLADYQGHFEYSGHFEHSLSHCPHEVSLASWLSTTSSWPIPPIQVLNPVRRGLALLSARKNLAISGWPKKDKSLGRNTTRTPCSGGNVKQKQRRKIARRCPTRWRRRPRIGVPCETSPSCSAKHQRWRLVIGGDIQPNPGPPYCTEDYQLRPDLFRLAIQNLQCPHPYVDAFATPQNALMANFWTEEINAFSKNWRSSLLPIWANPPFSQLGRVLAKIQNEGAFMILVLPGWHTWLQRFQRLARRSLKLPSGHTFRRQGRYLMPPPQWDVWVLLIDHTPASIGRGTVLTCGDVEQNPGPGGGPASPIDPPALAVGHVLWPTDGTPPLNQFRVCSVYADQGPSSATYLPQLDFPGPRLAVTCQRCGKTFFVRSPEPIVHHVCPWKRLGNPWARLSMEEKRALVHESEPAEVENEHMPRTGRGACLLSCGDIESNPGPDPHTIMDIDEGVDQHLPARPDSAPTADKHLADAGPTDLAHGTGLPPLPSLNPEQLVESIRVFGLRPLVGNTHPPCEIETLLKARIPTMRHIPNAIQREASQALAGAIQSYCSQKDTGSLWLLISFAKLILRPVAGKGKNPGDQTAVILRQRIGRFLKGDTHGLWNDACAQYPDAINGGTGPKRQRASHPPPRGEHPCPLTQSQLDRVRQLLADGAAKKALQLLNSSGVHDPTDPTVLQRLEALHPPPREDIPISLPLRIPPALEDAAPGFWDTRVSEAITHFPRGSAPGPSGLRPAHLQDAIKRKGASMGLLAALGTLTRDWIHGALPPTHATALCAANLTPLRKPDGGVRPVAVGETLRRMVGKALLATTAARDEISRLSPLQTGIAGRLKLWAWDVRAW